MSEPSPPPLPSPWQTVWLHPTQTMQCLLATQEGDHWAVPLLLAGGILSTLTPQMRELLLSLIPELNAQNITPAALILGIVSGSLQALMWPLLLLWAAKLLGATVPAQSVRPARLAAAWSSLPLLLGYLLAPLLATDETQSLLGLLNMLLSIWSLVLLAHMLASGYGFDSAKGALGVLLAGIFGFAGLFALSCIVIVLTMLAHS